MVVTVGSLMYLNEEPEHGFTSIPKSIYWAIVTMTTVGYGNIAPKTPMGQVVAALLMVVGSGIIAVSTGIVTSEMIRPFALGQSGATTSRMLFIENPSDFIEEIRTSG